jgi:hypothetical protein
MKFVSLVFRKEVWVVSRKRAKRHVAEKKDYKLLLEIAVVVGVVLLGYYLLGADGEKVGQAYTGLSCDTSARCDGTDLKGNSCESLGFTGGTLSCSECTLNTQGCTMCGNGFVDKGEQCDGSAMGEMSSCSELGVGEGDLGCTKYCLYDVRGCSG